MEAGFRRALHLGPSLSGAVAKWDRVPDDAEERCDRDRHDRRHQVPEHEVRDQQHHPRHGQGQQVAIALAHVGEAFLEQGKYLDHWVTEYWNEEKKCWVLFDSQIDNRQRELFRIGFDTADVPRDQFVVAGNAWSLCRGGRTDPSAFGILDMHGLWFIAGNLVRDFAALNNREMLPWDVWGAMRRQDSELDLAFFDQLAIVSREPDAHVNELSALYSDERVSVPGTVFNAVLNRPDPVP